MESLGQKLARFREEADLKQAALARLIGSTGPTLSKIENDVRAPTAASLSKLLLVFKRYLKWNDDEYRIIYNECFQQLRNSSSSIETTKDGEFNSVSKTIGIHTTPTIETIRSEQINKIGITDVHKHTDWEYLCSKLRAAKKEIRLLSTWYPDSTPMWQGLRDAIMNKVSIQVLLLNPESEIMRQRILDLRHAVNFQGVNGCLKNFQGLINDQDLSHSKMEIRLFTAIPPFSAYYIDGWCLLGFFWPGLGTEFGPRLELNDIESSILGRSILKTYDDLWSSASPAVFDNL